MTTASHAAVRSLVSQTTATAAKFLLDQMNLEFWCNCVSNSWRSESFLTMTERLLLLLLPLLLPLLQLPLLLHEDNHLKLENEKKTFSAYLLSKNEHSVN